MQSTQQPPLSPSSSPDLDQSNQAHQGSNVLPLNRAYRFSERFLPEAAAPNRIVSASDAHSGGRPAETTSALDSGEPAWRRAFVAPNGVRFTRTPDRVRG